MYNLNKNKLGLWFIILLLYRGTVCTVFVSKNNKKLAHISIQFNIFSALVNRQYEIHRDPIVSKINKNLIKYLIPVRWL